MSKDISRRITNLEVSFNRKGETIITRWDGANYYLKGRNLGVKTQQEVEEMFPHINLTFIEVEYIDQVDETTSVQLLTDADYDEE